MDKEQAEVLVPLPKASSNVWVHFGFRADKNGEITDRSRVKCRLCGNDIKFVNNTTNLISHLRLKHPNEHSQLFGTGSNSNQLLRQLGSQQPRQLSTCGAFVPVYPEILSIVTKRIENITEAIVNFLIKDLQALDLIENEAFKKFMETLEPNYEMPTLQYLSESYIPDMYSQICDHIVKPILMTGDNLVLTAEIWTSLLKDNYITTTIHFIDRSFIRRSYVLQTQEIIGQVTSANIASVLEAIFSEWNIDISSRRLSAAVTNNDLKVVSVMKEFKIMNICCFAMTIQTAIQAGFDVPAVEKILSEIRKIINCLRQNPFFQELQDDQQQTLIDLNQLKQDIPSQWNTTLQMLIMFRSMKSTINTFLDNKEHIMKAVVFSCDKWSEIDDIIAILEPFAVVCDALSAEDYPTASLTAPTIAKLIEKSLSVKNDNSEISKEMKVVVHKILQSQYMEDDVRKTLALSSALDPRFKSLPFLNSKERDQIYSDLEVTIVHLLEQAASSNGCPSNLDDEPPAKKIQTSAGLANFLEDMFNDGEKQGTTLKDIAATEIKNYRGEKALQLLGSPMDWWKQNLGIYPNLARFARLYLSIPATSIPSERLFTKAGHLLDFKRSSLPRKNIDKILFLHANCKYL